jgi:hypothetical protein
MMLQIPAHQNRDEGENEYWTLPIHHVKNCINKYQVWEFSTQQQNLNSTQPSLYI